MTKAFANKNLQEQAVELNKIIDLCDVVAIE
jgi:hypothetical protein